MINRIKYWNTHTGEKSTPQPMNIGWSNIWSCWSWLNQCKYSHLKKKNTPKKIGWSNIWYCWSWIIMMTWYFCHLCFQLLIIFLPLVNTRIYSDIWILFEIKQVLGVCQNTKSIKIHFHFANLRFDQRWWWWCIWARWNDHYRQFSSQFHPEWGTYPQFRPLLHFI